MATRTIDEGYSVNGSGGITRNTRQESYDPASESAMDLASQFMAEWRSNLGESERLFTETEDAIDNFSGYEDRFGEEFDKLEERFGGLRDDLLETAEGDLVKRNELGGMFMDAASADYSGARSRAVGDIATQAQRGREMQTRSNLARGIDPNSGAAQAGKSKAYLNEAVAKVLAANTATNQERLRAGQMAATGMNLFDPSRTAGLALNIQNSGNSLLNAQAGVASTTAGMRGNLATNYTQNITNPMAENAGTMTGYANGLNGSRSSGSGGTTQNGLMNPGFWDSTSLIPQDQPTNNSINYEWNADGTHFGML